MRSFASVGGEPFFVARAKGSELVDTDGRRYLDYVQSWGASILGHAHPVVVEAVQRAAADGTSYGAPTEREVELAEAIAARVPSVEKVRLVSSGTEAGMTVVRLARGATGRAKILKFAGCYHGHVDSLLVAAGSGVATLGLPGSAGVTEGTVADTLVVPYNDEAALDAVFAEFGDQLAAVLVEPIAANMGLVAPAPGFLEGLRRRCTDAGALLVFDEVITGFRVGPAGAQGLYGITPDLSMFGKVIGGGLPLAALGGRADLMDELAPLGPVYQAGTLSGNPLATAAGLAVLSQLDDAAYVDLTARATSFADGLRDALAGRVPEPRTGAPVRSQVTQVGTLTGLFFSDTPVTCFRDAQSADHAQYARFFHGMLDAGVFLPPSGYEAMFVSLAAHGRRHRPHSQRRRRRSHRHVTTEGYSAFSSSGRRRLRTWSMKNNAPVMMNTITAKSTNASPPPVPSLPPSTSCCALAGAASTASAANEATARANGRRSARSMIRPLPGLGPDQPQTCRLRPWPRPLRLPARRAHASAT